MKKNALDGGGLHHVLGLRFFLIILIIIIIVKNGK